MNKLFICIFLVLLILLPQAQNIEENQQLETDSQLATDQTEKEQGKIEQQGDTQDEEQFDTNSQLNEEESVLEEHLLQEWNKYMTDFIPDYNYNFVIDAHSKEIFYEALSENDVPCYFQGMFLNEHDKEKNIDLKIISPNGEILFEETKEREGLFHFNVTQSGTYSLIFNNENVLLTY